MKIGRLTIPDRILKNRRVLIARKAVELFGQIDAEQRAASFAYYALFSLVPMVALMLSVGSIFFSEEVVHRTIEEFVPIGSAQQDILWTMVRDLESARGGVSVVSLLVLGFTSLRFFQALVRAVNRAWHTVEIPWWQMPLKNLAMLGVFGGGLILGILVPAIIQSVVNALRGLETAISDYVPATGQLLDLLPILDLSRFLVGGGVLFYAFSMLYMLAPRRRVRFRQVWLPALGVTVAMQAVQIGFVTFLPRVVNYNVVYGSVGALMLLLLWIYVNGMIIIAGACFCAAKERVREMESGGGLASPSAGDSVTPANSGY